MGYVEDPDGYTNIRSGPGTTYEIEGKAMVGELVWILEKSGNWAFIVCACKDGALEGYMHVSRLKLVSDLPQLNVLEWSHDSAMLEGQNLRVLLHSEPFMESEHTIERDLDGYVRKIDGESPFGVDGGLPRRNLVSILIESASGVLRVKEVGQSGIYEPDFQRTSVYLQKTGELLIHMDNSDGAGGYTVLVEVDKDGNMKTDFFLL